MADHHEAGPTPSIAGAAWLARPETQAVLAALAAGGYPARVVGGAVRNTLLGLAVADIDIATPAVPDEVMRLANAAGLGVVPTGLQHGTVTVIADHQPYEVTTLRVDVATDGRHATVAFTDDWVADAGRRDFTINALYADASGHVYDPVGGYPDILARRVRFIGDAVTRIREDYLRILRFFRFYATYETATRPDPVGLDACIAEQAGLDGISAERIRVELLKTMVGGNARAAVAALAGTGILARVTGVVPQLAVFDRFVEIERALDRAPDPVRRLAALLVTADADAGAIARRLRLSSAERRVLSDAGRALGPPLPVDDDRAARRLLYALGAERFETHVLSAWAAGDAAIDDDAHRHVLSLPARWVPPVLPLDGAALLARRVQPGPRMGVVLRTVEAWWIANDFTADAAALDAAIDRAIAEA